MDNDQLKSYINASPRLPLIIGQQVRQRGFLWIVRCILRRGKLGQEEWFFGFDTSTIPGTRQSSVI